MARHQIAKRLITLSDFQRAGRGTLICRQWHLRDRRDGSTGYSRELNRNRHILKARVSNDGEMQVGT